MVLPLAPTPEETTAFLQPRGEFRAAITATAARLEARQAERKATPQKVALKELPAANASRSWGRRVNSLSIRSNDRLAGRERVGRRSARNPGALRRCPRVVAKALRDARQPAPRPRGGHALRHTPSLRQCPAGRHHRRLLRHPSPRRKPVSRPSPSASATAKWDHPDSCRGQGVWGYGVFYAVSGRLDQGACAALLSDGLQAHAGALPQALALDGKMIRHHLGLLTLAQHEDGAPQAVAASAVEFPFARSIVVVRSATTEKKKAGTSPGRATACRARRRPTTRRRSGGPWCAATGAALRSATTGAVTRSGAKIVPARVTPACSPVSPSCATPGSRCCRSISRCFPPGDPRTTPLPSRRRPARPPLHLSQCLPSKRKTMRGGRPHDFW